MNNRLRRFPKAGKYVLGAATLSLLWVPSPARAQSTATQSSAAPSTASQDRQNLPGDDATRRDLAQFDQFLDSHHDIAKPLRKDPSLVNDPRFMRDHPDCNAYFEDHPGVRREIADNPGQFSRLEDQWARDKGMRDRDAAWQGQRGQAGDAYQDQGRDAHQRDAQDFNRFLDQHREIGEQVRKNPSLCDDRKFVDGHPALRDYFEQHPGVRDQLRQNPNGFMQLAMVDNRDWNQPNPGAGMQGRDAAQRDALSFDRFLDQHREIGEQVRRDPSLCDNRNFLESHPALQAYLQQNPGVRDQLLNNPNAFMQLADRDNRDLNQRDDRMVAFGGWLGSHPDVQRDLERNPNCFKDQQYMQDHSDFNAYLNAHPDVQAELAANPQNFVQGAKQYSSGSSTGTGSGAGMNGSGTGMNDRGTGTTGSSTGTATGTGSETSNGSGSATGAGSSSGSSSGSSTTPPATTKTPTTKPNQ